MEEDRHTHLQIRREWKPQEDIYSVRSGNITCERLYYFSATQNNEKPTGDSDMTKVSDVNGRRLYHIMAL